MSRPNDKSTTTTPLWIPPLSLKDQRRIDRQRKRSQHQRLLWFPLRTGFKNRTLWECLELLAVLAIPVIIAAGSLWFTNQQSQATATASEKQHQTDLTIAQDQQQETAIQTYLDRMSDLLFTEHLGTSQAGDEVRQVARARTITLLPHLNGTRKGEVIQFLYEADLLQTKKKSAAIVSLTGANLTGADLDEADLTGADLSFVDLARADLGGANLSGADLERSDLGGADLDGTELVQADLTGAFLRGTFLAGADLTDANLSAFVLKAPITILLATTLDEANLSNAIMAGVDLSNASLNDTNLSGADLSGADLREADLREADLSGADLSGANLSGADLTRATGTTPQQLFAASSLRNAILPDGSKDS